MRIPAGTRSWSSRRPGGAFRAGFARRSAAAVLVLVVGWLWAAESVLGKVALARGYTAFDFPIVLNAGTVVACLGACLVKRNRAVILKVTREGLAAQAAVALTLVFVPYLVIYLSLRVLTPAETSLISSMTPMFSLLLGAAWFRTGIRPRHLGGVLAGLAGVAVLEYPGLRDPSRAGQAVWYLAMLAVPASYALSGFAVRRAGRLNVSYLQMLLVTNAVSLALFLAVNGGFALPAGSATGSAAVLPAGILCNVLSVVLLLRLSRLMSPLSLSLANYATVLFAFILSAVYLGEPVGATAAVAGALVTASSLLLAHSRDRSVP